MEEVSCNGSDNWLPTLEWQRKSTASDCELSCLFWVNSLNSL